MNTIEKKSCNFELKDLDKEQGIVAFYFSPFGVPDSSNDEATPTAFDKTFSENKSRIKHFRNHDEKEVAGTIIELGKDTKGAFAVSRLAIKTAVGNDTFEQYKAGIITEHSYGFQEIKAEKKSGKGRILKEVKLWEVSSLTHWGDSQYTPVISLKSFNDCADQLKKINNILTNGNISDELGEELLVEYKKVSENLKRFEKKEIGIDYEFLKNNL